MMKAAIEVATLGKGKTYPNPAVGAIIARGSRIVGKGYHRRAGLPHAEVEALGEAGSQARGADLYVTLEPCDHHGRTPPCTEAIIRSGIRRVFVATLDPNPLVNGRGIRRLRRAGLEVHVGLLADEARSLNQAYFTFMRQGRPFISLKVAQTIDGMIATRSGESKWVTSRIARAAARHLRYEAQALLVGINTVIKDDPLLLPVPRRKTGYLRCILDSHLKLPVASRIATTSNSYPAVVYCVDGSRRKRHELQRAGVEVKVVSPWKDGRVDIHKVVEDLASRQIMHLLVEGGASTLSSFLREGLFDRLLIFLAPKIMGGRLGLPSFAELPLKDFAECYQLRFTRVEMVGTDMMVELVRGAR